jgi:hypothetical protein
MKKCNRCHTNKDGSEFYKNSYNSDGLKSICKKCTAKTAKIYYDNNPDKIKALSKKHYIENKEMLSLKSKEDWKINSDRRKKSRLRPYGITPKELDLLFEQSNNKCNICSMTKEEHFLKYRRDLYIDHCHKNGKVRGILCHGCNLSLGNLKDDVDLLKNAIIYLQRWQH